MTSSMSDNIRAELARHNVTQAQLAEYLGTTEAAISRRLKGNTDWRVIEVMETAAFLHVPLSTLLPDN